MTLACRISVVSPACRACSSATVPPTQTFDIEHLGSSQRLTYLSLETLSLGGGLHALSRLVNLKHCYVTFPHFEHVGGEAGLCAAMGRLTALQSMSLSGCSHLRGLSDMQLDAFSSLSRLTALNLAENQLTSLEFGLKWQQIIWLNLRENNFQCMPAGITGLTALTSLDLSDQTADFQLQEPMDFLDSMTGLRHLYLAQGNGHKWSASSLFYLADAEVRIRSSAYSRTRFYYLRDL